MVQTGFVGLRPSLPEGSPDGRHWSYKAYQLHGSMQQGTHGNRQEFNPFFVKKPLPRGGNPGISSGIDYQKPLELLAMQISTKSTVTPILSKLMNCVRSPFFWIPAAVLVAATVLFSCTDLDVALIQPFFSKHAIHRGDFARFPLGGGPPWKPIRDWGIYPAWALGCGGLVVWFASFVWAKLKPWRDPGLFLFLALLIGPGLLINSVLKPYWDRPRPKQTVPFGGPYEFLPVWQPGCEGDACFSFPSGHAAAGFYLMTPAFFLYRRRPKTALAFLLLGLAAGVTIGIARMAAGCHFPSDVLWSAGVVYFTGLTLAVPFRFGDSRSRLPGGTGPISFSL